MKSNTVVQLKMTNPFIDLEITHFEMLKKIILLYFKILEISHKCVEILTYWHIIEHLMIRELYSPMKY